MSTQQFPNAAVTIEQGNDNLGEFIGFNFDEDDFDLKDWGKTVSVSLKPSLLSSLPRYVVRSTAPKTADYVAHPNELVLADASSNDVNVTLPDDAGGAVSGIFVTVKVSARVNPFAVNLVAPAGFTVEGAPSVAFTIANQAGTYALVGTDWQGVATF